MRRWLTRTGQIALAGAGLLIAAVLALGILTNVGVVLVQFVFGLPLMVWVAGIGFGGVALGLWWFR